MYKVIDSECSTKSYKSLKANTGEIMRNSETLEFVPGHLKTTEMSEHAVKKLPFVICYILI